MCTEYRCKTPTKAMDAQHAQIATPTAMRAMSVGLKDVSDSDWIDDVESGGDAIGDAGGDGVSAKQWKKGLQGGQYSLPCDITMSTHLIMLPYCVGFKSTAHAH